MISKNNLLAWLYTKQHLHHVLCDASTFFTALNKKANGLVVMSMSTLSIPVNVCVYVCVCDCQGIVQSCSYIRAQTETIQLECLPAHKTDTTDTNQREITLRELIFYIYSLPGRVTTHLVTMKSHATLSEAKIFVKKNTSVLKDGNVWNKVTLQHFLFPWRWHSCSFSHLLVIMLTSPYILHWLCIN